MIQHPLAEDFPQ